MSVVRFSVKLPAVLLAGVFIRILASFCIFLHGGVDMPPSVFVKQFGEAPVAFFMIFISYFFLALFFILFEKKMPGSKSAKGLKYGACFASLWMFGMFESCVAAGSPFLYELNFGLSDGLPIIAFGLLLGVVFGTDSAKPLRSEVSAASAATILCVAVVYTSFRYFSYAVIEADGAYFNKPAPAFLWTFVNGFLLGAVSLFLRDMVRDLPPLSACAVLGYLVIGSDIFLYYLFMPALMDFGTVVTIKKFFVREILDSTAVFLGLCIALRLSVGALRSRIEGSAKQGAGV